MFLSINVSRSNAERIDISVGRMYSQAIRTKGENLSSRVQYGVLVFLLFHTHLLYPVPNQVVEFRQDDLSLSRVGLILVLLVVLPEDLDDFLGLSAVFLRRLLNEDGLLHLLERGFLLVAHLLHDGLLIIFYH